MRIYIIGRDGSYKLTEEELEQLFRDTTFTTFNETNYKAWKFNLMAEGTLSFEN